MTTATRRDLTFPSGDDTLSAWHWPGSSGTCVVMAHGLSGTRDTGLGDYAEAFAAAGHDVVLFDYRGFGRSGGADRQHVSHLAQRDDYRASVRAARALPGVDPGRIVLWGTSYAGGHVIAVAAGDPQIAGVVSMTPSADGAATLLHLARHGGPGPLLGLSAAGLRDLARRLLRRAPLLVPAVGPAGSGAVMAKDGALELMQQAAGPTWRNEVRASMALAVALNRPVIAARKVTCPVLVQAGSRDTVVPLAAARRLAGRLGRGEFRVWDVDHFDVYGPEVAARTAAEQVAFIATL